MSLFGKFMAVLNFIGVTAVLVMALMVYSKRTTWQHANYLYDLALVGLPIDETDTDADERKEYLNLGDPNGPTLKDLFPNNPVTTQVQEVKRIKALIDAKRDGAADNRALLRLYADTLQPLADTSTRHGYYQTIRNVTLDANSFQALQKALQDAYPRAVAAYQKDPDPKKTFARELTVALRLPGPIPTFDPKNPERTPPKGIEVAYDNEPRGPFEDAIARAIQPDPAAVPNFAKPFADAFNEAVSTVSADLKTQYEAAFQEALNGQHPTPDGRSVLISQDQRRHAIARLLVALEDSLPYDTTANDDPVRTDAFSSRPFVRVLKIIGVKEMAAELNSEAAQQTRISQDLDAEIEQERTHFALAHAALLDEAQALALTVGEQNDQLKRLTDKIAAANALVAQREKNVRDAQTELADRRKYAAEMLVIIHKMQDSIHKTRVEVRDANDTNQLLAAKVRQLEKGR